MEAIRLVGAKPLGEQAVYWQSARAVYKKLRRRRASADDLYLGANSPL
jgi:hypothetical protein